MFSINAFIKRCGALGLMLFFSSNLSVAQPTFNKIYDLGFQTLITNVITTDSTFIVGGFVYDTIGIPYKGFLGRFDEGGETQFVNYLDDSTQYVSIGQDANAMLNDTTSLIAALVFASNSEFCKILWISVNGDTTQTRNYFSPYIGNGDQTDWMRPTSIDVDPEENIYVSCQLFWPDETGNDFVIMKLNAQGDSLWSYLVNEVGSESCLDIQAMDDGVIVGTNSITETGSQRFLKLSADGDLIWELTPDDTAPVSGKPNEFVVEPDGIVFTTEHSSEWTQWSLPAIVKTDYGGNILWSVFLSGSMENNGWQPCDHLVRSPDGGYLAAAWQFEEDPANPEVNGTFNWNAWLIKVSHEGVLEWQRFYHFIESTNDKHRVYDLKATSDGGYIFCGDAIDNDIETNGQVIQKGWLVKVDGCGCLVPGCDESCSTGVPDVESDHSYFIASPNPADQFLNLYFFNDHPDAELSMYDLSGRLVQSFVPAQGNTTYMLPVEDFPGGTYLLTLQENSRILQSMKIVIE